MTKNTARKTVPPHKAQTGPRDTSSDDKKNFFDEVRAVRKKKQELAAEAVRLKMSGKLSSEEEALLRETLGDDHDKLIPPDRVLQFLAGAGLSGPGPRDGGEAEPPFEMPPLVDLAAQDEELKMWQQNLQRGSNEGMDVFELAAKAAGSGDRYAGEVPLEVSSIEEMMKGMDMDGDGSLDPDKVYYLDGATAEQVAAAFGLTDLDPENLEEGTLKKFLPLDGIEGVSPDAIMNGLEDINLEEAGYSDIDEEVPGVGGEAVEAYLAELEAGKKIELPEGNLPQEDLETYRTRIQNLVDHYEDQFRKPRERKCPAEEAKKLDEQMRRLREEEGIKFDGTTTMPVDMSFDADNRRLAPEAPPEVEERFDRSAWLQLLLRRAHMSRDPMEPGTRLLNEGLLHEDCIYGDPVMVLRGAPRWLAMLTTLSSSGAYSQAANVMAVQTDEDPPNHYVVVDYFLNLRVPRELLADGAKPGIIWADRERERESGKINTVDDNALFECFSELKKDGIGCDWQEDAEICTIAVTTKYDIGGESGQVEKIDSCFGVIVGSLAGKAFEPMYVAACGGIDKSEIWDGEEDEYLFHGHPANKRKQDSANFAQ